MSEQGEPRFEPLPLSAEIRDHMARQVEAAYPEEACGALFGLQTGRSMPVVTAAVPLPNRAPLRRQSFRLEPGELELACRTRSALGESLLGFYHSHPDRSPMPSTFDLERAVPGLWQITIPVIEGRSGARRAWRTEGASACRR
ncbi:MAG: M67 family metallopeptidase [marine benthic group bacterium]|nr:M67 family metallopeptidase [Gemmatimonadota bacterium]